MGLSRRTVIQGLAGIAAAAATRPGRAASGALGWDTIVVGAGVFGAWSAWHLRRRGQRVLLVDAWGPAHSRASSGGESRMTRTSYGPDEVYSRMAWDSLPDWKWLSDRSRLPVFHPIGVLFFFPRLESYVSATIEVHRRLKLPTEMLGPAELRQRFPQLDWTGVEIALYEPELGALMARRAVQELVAEFVAAGGEYRRAAITPLDGDEAFGALVTTDGESLAADHYVFACGPWLPKMFPSLLGGRIFSTRQEIFFFSTPAGDTRFLPGRLPGWADYNEGDLYYGFPDLENRGFKIAHDHHGPPMDPDTEDRLPRATELADVRAFMGRRFPALAGQPLVESRVCQYENSSNGDFLIDRHPAQANVWLVGGGSGHGFKHGPAVGRYVADRVTHSGGPIEPRFSVATKALVQQRSVH
jgi:monomeric sarcosine oxidase